MIDEKFASLPDAMTAAEQNYIGQWRAKTGRVDEERPLTGLALSGGGIRSAVFCLGALQALAKHGILEKFDYLSTVSGGGYIGASLTWFTQSRSPFGVARHNLPYGIDDPTQAPPKNPPGTPLLPHLRRHGSYLDTGGPFGLLAGIAIVLRGLVLNLLVLWLPLVTAVLIGLRIVYRSVAYATASDQHVWVQPFTLAAIITVIFAALAIVFSFYSGWRALIHRDMPYQVRQNFERVAPYVLILLAVSLVLASLPLVRDWILRSVAAQGVGAFVLMIGSAALGLWSRLVPKGDLADGVPAWAGPIGATGMLYGVCLAGYALSGHLFIGVRIVPDLESLAYAAAITVFAFASGFIVNLNETTLHRFYRDRLMEAFMPDVDAHGAPTGRRASAADAGRLKDMCDPAAPKAPYHLICAHLVLTHVDPKGLRAKLLDRLRIRGGDSFVFSPRYCGSTVTGWQETAENKALSALSLPTVMAASGAAVNPNAASSGVGPERNTMFAILMALLNIRLGVWIPNPAKYQHKPHAPAPNHFDAGLRGVCDRASQTSRFLEITDGGNFENLGVYELLRRGVKSILVCDATADPQSAFDDLQNLLSRAEADFGVTISFATPPLHPLMPTLANARFPLGVGFAAQPYVVGSIRYPDGSPPGTIYYVKAAIFADLRLHVLGFKGAFPSFPDDSTVDQFFDEARFEAYRELGFASIDKMLQDPSILKQMVAM